MDPKKSQNSVSGPRAASDRALVLLVEDDSAMRRVVTRMLDLLGYAVLQARDGEEALELLREHDDVQLLISDITLAGSMHGDTLALHARELRADLRILFTSGRDRRDLTDDMDGAPVAFLAKPFGIDALSSAVTSILETDGAGR